MNRYGFLAWLALATVTGQTGELDDYLARPEPDFRWELRRKTKTADGILYEIRFVSQNWRDYRWTHHLWVYRPKKVEFPQTPVLCVHGGGPRDAHTDYGFHMANSTGAIFATLYDVPNQPLFDGLVEDDLIAHTLDKAILTKDSSWPLLLPMTKAATKAMDVIQAFSQQEWKTKTDGFVVTGASKRGWTTWLVAAHDNRVKAIVPWVYDNLNISDQMKHQVESWGDYSDKIMQYTRRNLQVRLRAKEGVPVGKLIDPYAYRNRLQLPKLIVNGTNDPYWTLDALNLYWTDLPGEKYVLYVPNAGHDLDDDLRRASQSTSAFYRHVVGGEPWPKLEWKHGQSVRNLRLTVTAVHVPEARAARLWVAHSPGKDFRAANWESSNLPWIHSEDGMVTYQDEILKPASGRVALFAELEYESNGQPFYLSTSIRIAGKK